MPLTTLHLLSLTPPHTPSSFLAALPPLTDPILAARPIRWIITPSPTTIPSSHTLLTHSWHLLLLLHSPLPAQLLAKACTASYTITLGIPSRVLSSFAAKNSRLLHPHPGDTPALTGALDKPRLNASAQDLELTTEVLNFVERWDAQGWGTTPVSMLNLLSFVHGKDAEYRKYGAAFGESAGKRRGGDAKIVGKIVGAPAVAPSAAAHRPKRAETLRVAAEPGIMRSDDEGPAPPGDWEEVAIAHYPSMWHFADMLASDEYQEANQRYRVGSLKDTCILMTSEVVLERERAADSAAGSKL